MNEKERPCLLWIDEANVFAPVPESTIEALRAKGVTVLETNGVFTHAVRCRFFEIQRSEVAA
jgi:hypothetical protein